MHVEEELLDCRSILLQLFLQDDQEQACYESGCRVQAL